MDTASPFDLSRAALRGPDAFPRFRVAGRGRTLGSVPLRGATLLLVFERAGERHALFRRQMAYHHAAQGEARGEPWLVTF